MTLRVDFYVLENAVPDGKLRLTCRLAEKAFRLGHRVYILVESSDEAGRLDDLLWSFSQGSFVPHARAEQAGEAWEDFPVRIGTALADPAGADVLISLLEDVPEHFDRFPRIAEPVTEDKRSQARRRFRFYREHGAEMQTHRISL